MYPSSQWKCPSSFSYASWRAEAGMIIPFRPGMKSRFLVSSQVMFELRSCPYIHPAWMGLQKWNSTLEAVSNFYYFFLSFYYSDVVMSTVPSRNEYSAISSHRRLDGLPDRLFRRKSKTVRDWLLWGEFTCDRWIRTFGNRCLSAIGGGNRWSRFAGWVQLSAEAAWPPRSTASATLCAQATMR